jgi:hypothetical protein
MTEIPRSERKTQNRVIALVPQRTGPADQSKLNDELLLHTMNPNHGKLSLQFEFPQVALELKPPKYDLSALLP